MPVPSLQLARCCNCDLISLWMDQAMIYPPVIDAPPPNADLDEAIQRDYMEAAMIVRHSPRGAAALLRLCIQKLCKQLGEKGQDINTDIGNLVKKGLPFPLQQALDIVRVIGNESIHPGQMDMADDGETARQLFALVNLVTERMISLPKQVDALYQSLPQGKRDGIAQRDNQAGRDA